MRKLWQVCGGRLWKGNVGDYHWLRKVNVMIEGLMRGCHHDTITLTCNTAVALLVCTR